METELCGLTNFGNTCWLNAAIQCLLKTIPLSNYINNEYSNKINNTLLASEWLKLLNGIKDENCIITPLSLFKSIIISSNKNGYMFNFNRQNDVQEFLLFFIDSLHEEVKKKVNITISGKIMNPLDKMAFDAMKEWKQYFKNNYSQIIEIFYGQLVSKIKVVDEEIYSYTYSPVCFFSLPMSEKTKPSIYDCFDIFTKKQLLDGDNKWKNDEDGKYYDIEKNLLVWKFPNILIIQLKRFNNNGQKINTFIDIPYNLDLQKYCVGYDKKNSLFSLYAVCNHIGSMNSGHYYSYCKHNNNWYNFDDNSVRKIDAEDIITNNAYCLFFIKK
jgi:ubiquitin carboxyl-terminal hydrolase 8